MRYYATYKNIGESDIAAFNIQQDRDDWVNFRDPFSIALGINADNCTFERTPVDNKEAEQRIKTMLHKRDEFNPGQEWYIGY